jgi:hypothetical protein
MPSRSPRGIKALGDAEIRRVAARRRNTRLGAGNSVLGMHQAEKKFGPLAELEIAKRPMERIIAALYRHRHVKIGELVRDRFRQRIGELDHPRRIFRLDEMPRAEIAVAEMQAKLDVVGYRRAQTLHAPHKLFARHVCGHRVGRLAVPDDHLVADVPLDAKIAMRNMPAERRNLGNHGALVGGFDGRHHFGNDNRAHDRKGRRQADLKADAFR